METLRWVQPNKLKMHYELVRGKDVLATLRFKSLLGSLATYESPQGCWTFKRTGFFQGRATIRACGSETDIATFRNNTWKGGGTFEFPDGRQIRATTNFWMSQLEFLDASDVRHLAMKYDSVWGCSATVDFQGPMLSAAENAWMVAFGWYLMVMMQMDTMSGGALTPILSA